LASGGESDTFTEKKAIIAARRSMAEWMASERILTDPLKIPAKSFMMIRQVLEMMERRAVLTFFSIALN
jgi:hypothetical protein